MSEPEIVEANHRVEVTTTKALKRQWWVLVSVLIMIFLTAAAWATVRNIAQDTKELAEKGEAQRLQLLELVERIDSCTTVDGECFQEAQSRQVDVIGDPRGPINTVVVAAAYCAKTLPMEATYDQLRTCTVDTLAAVAPEED
jgi:hypothetical protein